MPQSLDKIYLHLVFSTKNREAWLSPELRTDLHAYLGGVCNGRNIPPVRIGGVADHVHLLARFPRTVTVAAWVEEVKTTSSKWIKPRLGNNRNQFAWQRGYGVFSISPSHVDPLIHYIDNQEAHHRKETFQDEMRRFFKKYEVEFDEKYVWD